MKTSERELYLLHVEAQNRSIEDLVKILSFVLNILCEYDEKYEGLADLWRKDPPGDC